MANIGYIQAVRHCNHFCGFCSNPPAPFFHTLETMRHLVDDFVRRGYFGVILTGGEPTLHPDLPAVAAYARQNGLHVRMITNGMRLADPDYARELAEAGVQIAHVSVYSTRPDAEEAMRGVAGTLDTAFLAVDNAHAAGIEVNSNCVITKLNADHLDETVAYWIDNHPHVRHFVWNNLDVAIGRAQANRDVFLHRLADCEASLQRALRLLDESGRSFRVEKVAPCFMGEFAWASTELRKLVKGEERLVHFLDAQQSVRQTLWGDTYGPACDACDLRPVCPGVYSQGNGYSPEELKPSTADPRAVVERVISDDRDPSSTPLTYDEWSVAFERRMAEQAEAARKLEAQGTVADRRLLEKERPGSVAVGEMSERSVASFHKRRRIAERKASRTGVSLDPVLYPGMDVGADDDGATIVEFGGTRAMLLGTTTRCNLGCAHCPLPSRAQQGDRPTADCISQIERGRQSGCTELVFTRGEATLRPDLPTLIGLARDLGYDRIALQTNGRMLTYRRFASKLVDAGCRDFEVSVFGASPAAHDAVALEPGAFEQTLSGIRNVVALGADCSIAVPVLAATAGADGDGLESVVALASELGVEEITFETPGGAVELEDALLAGALDAALSRANDLGIATSVRPA